MLTPNLSVISGLCQVVIFHVILFNSDEYLCVIMRK
jgi:hypothetical protein